MSVLRFTIRACFLPDKVLDELEAVRRRFPSMATLIEAALKRLLERETPPDTRVPPGKPDLLARYVPNSEGNPGPDEELAPDYVIVYEPLLSWTERRRHKARNLVVRILSAIEAGGKYWTDPPDLIP